MRTISRVGNHRSGKLNSGTHAEEHRADWAAEVAPLVFKFLETV